MTDANLITALVQSICGPLANKVKFSAMYARKNKKLGEGMGPTIDLLFEQLLPQFCATNLGNQEAVNNMHNLVFLLAHKSQQVFTSHVIHTAIDQNWDMKGLKQVLVRILKTLDVSGYDALTTVLDAQIKNQNLQSSSCIKAINSFVRNPKKTINQDDLANSISTYETDFEFIREDIEKYRVQRIKYECFSVLHPWAYDLDQVDFKYIINNNISDKVISSLSSVHARVFWLSHFKCQASVSADDFFQALRESWEISKCSGHYEHHLPTYKQAAAKNDYIFSIVNNAQEICDFVNDVTANNTVLDTMITQVKTYTGSFQGSPQIKMLPSGFEQQANPSFATLQSDKFLGKLNFQELTDAQRSENSSMQRRPFDCLPNKAATHKLNLQFEAVDTEEIKGLGITFDGSSGIFKIGEGDANHYQIPNDKKLWESQLMIVCKDGKYFVRDLGIVHTSRIKIDKNTEVQIQQDMLVDLGKVVHYHFNKVTHAQRPSVAPSQNFQVLFSNNDYAVEEDASQEPPALRARPTWVSSDESKDNIQKEILLEAYSQHFFSVGRSAKREVQIKLKAVSADHCSISYDNAKGWSISEKGKDKLSSNGTFVFMKSHGQMAEHEPSDLIPLHDGMVLSFINYEIRVNLEKKDGDIVSRENQQIADQNQELAQQAHDFKNTMKASATPNVAEIVQEIEVKEEQQSENNFRAPIAAPEETKVEEEMVVQQIAPPQNFEEEGEDDRPVHEASIHEEAPQQVLNDSVEEPVPEAVIEQVAEPEQQVEQPAVVIEEPKAESPKKVEEPVVEEPKAAEEQAQAQVQEPAVVETVNKEEVEVQAEEPKVEEPKVEEVVAVVEQVKAENPEVKVAEAVVAEVEDEIKAEAKIESPTKVDSPKNSPKKESPKAESPKAESPKKESPKKESPKNSPKKESPKAESPKAESPKKESPKKESPKAESPKAESPKAESPKKEEAQTQETAPVVVEEPTKVEEAPKAEEPIVEQAEAKVVEEVVELVKAEEVAEVNAEAAHQESPTKVDTPQKEESKVESEAVETKVEDKVIVATEEVTTDKQAEVKNESPAKVDSPKSSPKKDSPKAETPTKDDKAE